jgi:large subunit ribosomal protein L5
MYQLQERYQKEVRDQLMKDFELQNVMQVPRVEKVVVNVGVGSETQSDSKALDAAVSDMTIITGQKPIIAKARKSIANFKLRENKPIGVKVTLRGQRMWAFLDRLMNVALPRVRDFRGVPSEAFDGRGNYTLGLREQLVFPEIEYDKIDATRGMDITIVTTADTNEHGKALLDAFGFPFKRGEEAGAAPKKQKRRGPVRGGKGAAKPAAKKKK